MISENESSKHTTALGAQDAEGAAGRARIHDLVADAGVDQWAQDRRRRKMVRTRADQNDFGLQRGETGDVRGGQFRDTAQGPVGQDRIGGDDQAVLIAHTVDSDEILAVSGDLIARPRCGTSAVSYAASW